VEAKSSGNCATCACEKPTLTAHISARLQTAACSNCSYAMAMGLLSQQPTTHEFRFSRYIQNCTHAMLPQQGLLQLHVHFPLNPSPRTSALETLDSSCWHMCRCTPQTPQTELIICHINTTCFAPSTKQHAQWNLRRQFCVSQACQAEANS
jgi:hypothetical protein